MTVALLTAALIGPEDGPEPEGLALLRSTCVRCHGARRAEGGLDLDELLARRPLYRDRARWEQVRFAIDHELMPPESSRAPSSEHRYAMSAWIDDELTSFDPAAWASAGTEPLRRLTHEEYRRTMRDLFGVEEVGVGLPPDLKPSLGFQNAGDALFLHPQLLESYWVAAGEVVARAWRDVGRWPLLGGVLDLDDGAEDVDAEISRVLSLALPFIWRRPVAADERTAVLGIAKDALEHGRSIREALRVAMRTALVSPHFLYKVEGLDGAADEALNGFELATRLSYLLWASTPDRALWEEAAEGRLETAAALRVQAQRMLADPRAASLGELFATEWLGTDLIGTAIRPDPIDNPGMRDSMLQSLREETSRFVAHLFRDNRPLVELVTADYSFLNSDLKGHYGLKRVRPVRRLTPERAMAGDWTRVTFDDGVRGGVLGHASIHMITSHDDEVSPVLRGSWMLTRLLGTPPPPPPPDVSELADELQEEDELSHRQKLERHRADPQCAACHDRIDPLGFALSRYDSFGRYLDEEEIDDRGRLPAGVEFRGLSGLRRVLAETAAPQLHEQLTRRLFAYALGRETDIGDEQEVRRVLSVLDASPTFGTLLNEVVGSRTFRVRQPAVTAPRRTTDRE